MPLSDQLQDILDSLSGFGPTVWLIVAFCGMLVAELILGNQAGTRQWLAGLTVGAFVIAGCWVVWLPVRGFLFLHLLFIDEQAILIQLIAVLTGILVVAYEALAPLPFLSTHSRTLGGAIPSLLPANWYALLLSVVIGLFLMAMSVNLLAIYMSVELVSIGSYLLTALTATRKASEGGIKYLLVGAVASAVMLYGMSLLYGLTGTLDLTSPVFTVELAKNPPIVLVVAGLLTLSGLFFKLAVVPFHVWTPDAYEAAPLPVVAFLSVAPKAAALLVVMRLVSAWPPLPFTDWQTPLAVVALASMLLGNLSAFWQTDAKRLLAYSGIAHAGFLLVGVVALTETGFESALFYAATYLPINLAAFFLIDQLRKNRTAPPTDDSFPMASFAGQGAQQPLLAIALTITMLALTGLPPTVGFTAKLLIFTALYDAYQTTQNGWLLALFGLGLLNAVLSLAYYLRIPFLLFFRPSSDENKVAAPVRQVSAATGLSVLLAFLTVLLFLRPGWLLNWISGF